MAISQDILFAAVLALILTFVISSVSRVVKIFITRSTELGYRQSDVEIVLQRCYSLFPIENLHFNGATITRGMQVRVITNRNATIEGEFVGANEDNMVCFLTPSSVIAHELKNIEEMDIKL